MNQHETWLKELMAWPGLIWPTLMTMLSGLLHWMMRPTSQRVIRWAVIDIGAAVLIGFSVLTLCVSDCGSPAWSIVAAIVAGHNGARILGLASELLLDRIVRHTHKDDV